MSRNVVHDHIRVYSPESAIPIFNIESRKNINCLASGEGVRELFPTFALPTACSEATCTSVIFVDHTRLYIHR